jgi:hypothetical protein
MNLKAILDSQTVYINGMELLSRCCDVIAELISNNVDIEDISTQYQQLEDAFLEEPSPTNYHALKDFYKSELAS